MIGLIDCNNFFVSCERVFNPSLCGRPVLVLSGNDGCVISRSNEAKKLGIKMGIPVFQIKKEIARHHIITCSSNHILYSDMSRRIMSLLGKLVPKIEIYSIDEAFIDLSDIPEDPVAFGKKIVRTIAKSTGIPLSLGIAPTKTLAKLASHYAKNHSETQHVYCWNQQEETAIMKTMPINEIWGIGRRYAKTLESYGKHSVYDFHQASPTWIKKFFTIQGERIWKELHGESCLEVSDISESQKSICISRTFASPITRLAFLEEAIAFFTSASAHKLRQQHSFAQALQVFLHTNRFDESNFYNGCIHVQLPVPTQDSAELNHYSREALLKIFKPGLKYKRAGIILYDFTAPHSIQGNLFDKSDRLRQQQLMHTIDTINQKIGKDKIKLALEGNGESWKSKKIKLSPCYTTNFDDILTLNV